MKGDYYYVKVMPRFNVGGTFFFYWSRSIGLLRRHRFISFLVCFCLLNVFFVIDILVNCGYFVDLNSANGRVHPPPPFRPSDFPLEGTANQFDVRLLCWISSTSRDKENSIRETWGKRCDTLIFVANSPLGPANQTKRQNDAGAGIVRLFARTTLDVLKQLHDQNYLNDSDWFLKADAATFVVVDQLKLMLSTRNTATPCYLAGNNKRNNSEIIGDAYVLSRESIRRLVRQFRRRNLGGGPADCDWSQHPPNNIVTSVLKSVPTRSRCLDRLGIVSGSTLDDRGCERFLSQSLAKELILNNDDKTRRCISDRVVIFSRLGEHDFYFYEHLLYRLKMPAIVMK